MESYTIDDIKEKDFIIVGHRGAAGHAPENTMASFRKAIELGADVIELDVHRSKDGHLVVMHDATVDRTTNGSGAISDMTYDEIRALDAGGWFGEAFKGELAPSLAEVIVGINGEVKVLIEIKWPNDGLYDGLGKQVAEEVHKYGAEEWCIIQSFDSKYLDEAHAAGYNTPLQKLLVSQTSLFFVPFYQDNRFRLGRASTTHVESINYHHKMINASLVQRHHDDGLMVIPYTVNTTDEMVKVLGMGVDGVITNYPDVALALRNELK
ncbi:MAG: glycerophosphodiester phosphodiesterase family protein [Imperialibacter sp.]|uniref:glycerophosphodiester phosphodiesterase n=1 Tax=Imperialibacter sp. TaxID=2038411 RepID=UPI0032EB407A